MKVHDRHYIDGGWVRPQSAGAIDVHNAATEEVKLATGTVKRVALELGGKSASIVLEDADLPRAVKGTLNSCFLNSG